MLAQEPGRQREREVEADRERSACRALDEVPHELGPVAPGLEAHEPAVGDLGQPDLAPLAAQGAGPVDGDDVHALRIAARGRW
jgi:hypothetical protein